MSTIIPLEQAQAAIISYLKSMPALVAALGSANQIKEWSWQGDDFTYPCVRLQMGFERPEPGTNCCRWLVSFYVMCFSSKKSSKETSQLASIVASIHGYQPGVLNGINFSQFFVDQIIPPIRQDNLTWRSEVVVHTRMSCYTPPVVIPWYLKGGVDLSNCKIAYQPQGAASLGDSYINLPTPGVNNANPTIVPGWNASDGWIGNSDAYIDIPISPSNVNWTYICKFSDFVYVGDNAFVFGGYDLSFVDSVYVIPNILDGHSYFTNGEALSSSSIFTSGVIAIAGNKVYKNGVDLGLTLGPWTDVAPVEYITLLGVNSSMYIPQPSKLKMQAFSMYNAVLTPAQILAITNAMNAL